MASVNRTWLSGCLPSCLFLEMKLKFEVKLSSTMRSEYCAVCRQCLLQ